MSDDDETRYFRSDSKRKLKQLVKLSTEFGEQVKEIENGKTALHAQFDKRLAALAQSHKSSMKKITNSVVNEEGDSYERNLPEYEKKFVEMAGEFEKHRAKRKRELDTFCSSILKTIKDITQTLKSSQDKVDSSEKQFFELLDATKQTLTNQANETERVARLECVLQSLFQNLKQKWIEMYFIQQTKLNLQRSTYELAQFCKQRALAADLIRLQLRILRRENHQREKYETELLALKNQSPMSLYKEFQKLRRDLGMLIGGESYEAFLKKNDSEYESAMKKHKERITSTEHQYLIEQQELKRRLNSKYDEQMKSITDQYKHELDKSIASLVQEYERSKATLDQSSNSGAVISVCDTTLENVHTQLEMTQKRIKEERGEILLEWQKRIGMVELDIEGVRWELLQATMRNFLRTYQEMFNEYIVRFEDQTQDIIARLNAEMERETESYLRAREDILGEIRLSNEKFVNDQQVLQASKSDGKDVSGEEEINEKRAEYRKKFFMNELEIADLQKKIMEQSTVLNGRIYKFGEIQRSHESQYIVHVEELRKTVFDELQRLRDIKNGLTGVLDERIEVLEMQRDSTNMDIRRPEILEQKLAALTSQYRRSTYLLESAKRFKVRKLDNGILSKPIPRLSK